MLSRQSAIGQEDMSTRVIEGTAWGDLAQSEIARLRETTKRYKGDSTLVERGLLEPRGERRGRSYHLSAAVYRKIGQRAAYVRVRGFEAEQQRQMVLHYAKKHGEITRREMAELCHVSNFQATRLLSSLVKGGHITLHGKGKGAFYTPAGDVRNGRDNV